MRHHVRTALTALVAATLAAIGCASAAHADSLGTSTPSGYSANVEVHLTGDVSKGLAASVPGPPPRCWWENLSTSMLDTDKVDTSDPV